MKRVLKKIFPKNIQTGIRKGYYKYLGYVNRKNLDKLALIHRCDKWGVHFYTPHYQSHFKKFRKGNINLLEIGVGGYKKANRGGASLRMWKDYFRKANIFAIDIYDKSALEEKRVKIFQGNQTDIEFLTKLIDEIGHPNIIIDDGSHMNEDIIKTFNFLFPRLKEGGVYVVEDLQCSYWPWYGGSSNEISNSNTAINYFRDLVHGLNHSEFIIPGYEPSYFEQNITSIHFYHNIVFIQKGKNNEPSSFLLNNSIPE